MDKNRKWRLRLAAGLQVAAAAVITGAVLFLLWRYVRYGERSAREAATGIRQTAVQTEDLPETQEFAPSELQEGTRLPDSIRVRILDDAFAGAYHAEVALACEKAFTVKQDGRRIRKGRTYAVRAEELAEGQVLQIRQKDGLPITVTSLKRADAPPQYQGTLWLYREADGIALVNELSLEEYLCGVVASEMPSDYPLEAQKAQAVCARTYACNCIRTARENFAADLDDSVGYQVYNNYQANEQSRRAVEGTKGEILPLDEIQYYSTSCQSEQRGDLDSDEAFREFLSREPDAGAEFESPWLRWTAELSAQRILKHLEAQYGWLADSIEEIRVVKRAGNGQVQELEIRNGSSVRIVRGEYEIRQALSPAQATLRLRDGEERAGMAALPSAFFWIECEPGVPVETVTVHGGGYGHGIGMSQYGAAALAEKGLDYREILEYYYHCEVIGG